MNTLQILLGDNLDLMKGLPEKSFSLIVIDPPYNTGKKQTGKKGSYEDTFANYLDFMRPRLEEAKRLLTDNGSIFVHLDYREVHYLKVEMDKIFGRKSFINELIWSYDFGSRSKSRWSAKHDNILWYAKDPNNYIFNYDAIDRIPYMAPKLVGPAKAAKGKTPTDVWWNTIVHTTGKERVGYPTQKPIAILNRIIKVHSKPGDHVLDFFAGSGTTGAAALENGRNVTLIDENPEAIKVMNTRLLPLLASSTNPNINESDNVSQRPEINSPLKQPTQKGEAASESKQTPSICTPNE